MGVGLVVEYWLLVVGCLFVFLVVVVVAVAVDCLVAGQLLKIPRIQYRNPHYDSGKILAGGFFVTLRRSGKNIL